MSNALSKDQREQEQRAVLPAVDVFEDAAGITLLADMPGVSKERLELRVEGDALSIEGRVRAADTRRAGARVCGSARAALSGAASRSAANSTRRRSRPT